MPLRRKLIPLVAAGVVVLAVALLLLLLVRGRRPGNVLLITIDTLRPDHLGCYGYAQIKTPNIDRLAAEGIRFEKALAPVPLTTPYH